jgi:hypothetical protein
VLKDSTPPSKETNWQTGLKRKIQQSVVYKHCLRLSGWKKEDLPSEWPTKTAGMSDKIDFKSKLVKRETKVTSY